MFKRFVLCVVLLLAGAGSGQAGFVASLDDVQVWVGSGSNRAAFVVDWNTGGATESLVWGYRWDGTATGEDMLRALAAANVGIYAELGNFGPGLGFAVFGIGFDLDRDGQFGTTPPLTFVNGIASGSGTAGVNDSRVASDPGDAYREGWFSAGFWGDYTKPDAAANWSFSPVGLSSQTLTDGSWDGWSFAVGFASQPPSEPVNPPTAAPAPSGLVLAAIGAATIAGWKLRRRRPVTRTAG